MVDGLSLASSIVTFLDAAAKVKDTLSKAGSNDDKLQAVLVDILRGLAGIERLCRAQYSNLNESQAKDLKQALDDLRDDMMEVQARAKRFLSKQSTSFIASAASRAKAWLRRGAIEAEATRLENRIRACYTRFLTFTAARTEYAVLVNHQEYMDQLEHMEDLVSYMLLRNNQDSPARNDLPEPDEIDYQFAHRQVLKLVDALDNLGESWRKGIAAHPFVLNLTLDPDLRSRGQYFRRGLRCSLKGLQDVKILDASFIINVAVSMLQAADAFLGLSWNRDSRMLSRKAIEIFDLCHHASHCAGYERHLAYSQLLSATVSLRLHDPLTLSIAENATKMWQNVYDLYPGELNLLCFRQALSIYDTALFRHGQYVESLDCSRQALLLMRMTPMHDDSGSRLITWFASGEMDVVFSSEREVSQSVERAVSETSCLWNLAKSLATASRYAEALIAATDAVSCQEALLPHRPSWGKASRNLTHWRAEMSTWASIIENPSTYRDRLQHASASIEELNESE